MRVNHLPTDWYINRFQYFNLHKIKTTNLSGPQQLGSDRVHHRSTALGRFADSILEYKRQFSRLELHCHQSRTAL